VAIMLGPERPATNNPVPRRLKILVSAYACEPGKGSEPAVGWNTVLEAAQHHEVWAITRTNNRAAVEAELARVPVPGLHMVYYDLPRRYRWWKRGARGTRPYYYLWQLGVYSVARRLHRVVRFDVTHHVTFASYWVPTLLSWLPAPFLWGPVGGGESAPARMLAGIGWRGIASEVLRGTARWCGERDPLVRMAARRCALALATTDQTARRLRHIGARRVSTLGQLGLSASERSYLESLGSPAGDGPVRFLSLGNLLYWKGFHLGLKAFAAAGLAQAEYWLVGDGPDRPRLQRLVRELEIADKVRFHGRLPRAEALRHLSHCHALVHPSLHDSGGWVCIEAMAAGKPVICLDLGGPGAHVTLEAGFKVPALAPDQVVQKLALAMVKLGNDTRLRERMGQAGKRLVATAYAREGRARLFNEIYQAISAPAEGAVPGQVATVLKTVGLNPRQE
jgi:glycosyltransferase involved in cell wall biosynthesis